MPYRQFIKTERFPTTWCGGCGLGIILRETAKVFEKLGFKKENTVVVSGIGCSGRAAGYFKLDSVHTTHGRAIPVAEGIKRGNKDLNVIVISGDGDLLGIGGNHLLHSARRGANITILCVDNEIYGMTGGQMAPTTKKGVKTLTSPYGDPYEPINVQGLLLLTKKHFYARTTVFHIEHLNKCIKEAIEWQGFSFVDIISDCITNDGRRRGYKNAYEMLISYRENYKINSIPKKRLEDNELGVISSN
jgi:2-oxoglutarate ferredoxin oxidoreductase subunit beta